ncbi:MAG: ABC transporter ATP-binding protein [Peptococcaceae bacterium BICA1-8]|nr:MAG: ABC transporter ATP-binding protein [Peptococcaceae bacterium BICA1-8]
MFSLKNVKYKNILVIKELNLPQEKITCIVGESGSGKTTLLKLLNNLISCDQGDILYKQQSIYDIDPIELRREVVMLPQDPAIFPGTVKENLLIGIKFAEKPLVDNEKLQEVLEQVKLRKPLTNIAEQLSGGEKQRLALGRVLLLNPEVFLLDEPSSAMDEETEELVIESIVQDVRKNKKSLVMITHAKKIAQKYGDYLIELKNGLVLSAKEL